MSMKTTDNIGLRIRRLRKERGISLPELGKAIGMWKTAICNIEHGRGSTSIENLVKIADYFNVSLDYLVGRDHPLPFTNPPLRHLDDLAKIEHLDDLSKIDKTARAAAKKLIKLN